MRDKKTTARRTRARLAALVESNRRDRVSHGPLAPDPKTGTTDRIVYDVCEGVAYRNGTPFEERKR